MKRPRRTYGDFSDREMWTRDKLLALKRAELYWPNAETTAMIHCIDAELKKRADEKTGEQT